MGIKEEIKQTKFKSPIQKAIVNIYYTANWLRDKQQHLFKKHNILPQHYNIIRIVKGKNPNPVSPSEIKDVMLDKGRDLTRLVDKLVSLKILERKLCDDNRRKMEITITQYGIDICNKVEQEMTMEMETKFNLSDEEGELLSDLLDKLRED